MIFFPETVAYKTHAVRCSVNASVAAHRSRVRKPVDGPLEETQNGNPEPLRCQVLDKYPFTNCTWKGEI